MKKVGDKEYRETGVLIALILIIIGLLQHELLYCKIAAGVLLLLFICPILFRPIAIVWFSFAYKLSKISSFVVLSLVYVVVLLPVALLMKIFGRDVLKLKQFKKGTQSVFTHRAHRFVNEDILHPY